MIEDTRKNKFGNKNKQSIVNGITTFVMFISFLFYFILYFCKRLMAELVEHMPQLHELEMKT
jgi:hypothetical protein